MYSGLEREQTVLRRQRSVAWAWIKARGIMKNQANAAHAKLTSSVLLTADCNQVEEIASWRDNLAAFNHRSLAQQICDQFYDISILSGCRGHTEATTAERVLETFLPATNARESTSTGPQAENRNRQGGARARIMTAVLPEKAARSAVLISIRTRAA